MYSWSFFQIILDCTFYLKAQLIGNGLVLWLLTGAPYTEFSCLKMFPLHRHSFWDCLRILAHTFDIGLLLLMQWAALSKFGKRKYLDIEVGTEM